MNSLVADYGDETDSDSSENDSNVNKKLEDFK